LLPASPSGVNTTIRIVPIAVNTTLYDPDKATPLNLPRGKIVFGFHKRVLPPVSDPPINTPYSIASQ
jgi:hypothetical protein